MALGLHEFARVAAVGGEVLVLVRLGTLLAAAHLSLVQSVACSDRVLVCGHRDAAHLCLFKKWAAHRLLSLLPGGWRINHLLRLHQKFVDSAVLTVGDGGTSAHPVHVACVDWHLLGVDKLVHHGL